MTNTVTRSSAIGVSVALVVLAPHATGLRVLLRAGDRRLGLPGAPLDPAGSVQDTRDRVLTEHAHLFDRIALVSLLDTVGPHRRPDGGAVVTIAHVVLAQATAPLDQPGSAQWIPVRAVSAAEPVRSLIDAAVERCRVAVERTTVAADLCEPTFTVAALREVFEAFWGGPVDPRNFHRKVTGVPGFLVDTGARTPGGPGRPAVFYRKGDAAELYPALRSHQEPLGRR